MGESSNGLQAGRDEIRVSRAAAWAGGPTSWPRITPQQPKLVLVGSA